MRHLLPILIIGSLVSLAAAEPSERGRPGEQSAPPPGAGGQGVPGHFQFDPPAGVAEVRVMKSHDADGMTTTVHEDDREINITENDDGIKVTIRNGDGDPQEYRAKDAPSLEKESPEAFEVYQRYSVPVNRGGGLAFPHDPDRAMMPFPMNGGKIENLAIRADFMPNPALRAQLGAGVVVLNVRQGGRGHALGLQALDYIKTVNGKEVATADEVEAIVAEADKVEIQVLRGGKSVTLSE